MATKSLNHPHFERHVDWARVRHVLAVAAWPAGIVFVLAFCWWALGQLVHGMNAFSSEAYMNGFSALTGAVLVPGFIPMALVLVLPLFAAVVILAIAIAYWTTREMWLPRQDR